LTLDAEDDERQTKVVGLSVYVKRAAGPECAISVDDFVYREKRTSLRSVPKRRIGKGHTSTTAQTYDVSAVPKKPLAASRSAVELSTLVVVVDTQARKSVGISSGSVQREQGVRGSPGTGPAGGERNQRS